MFAQKFRCTHKDFDVRTKISIYAQRFRILEFSQTLLNITLKEEIFTGRKFREFRGFFPNPRNQIPAKFFKID